MISLKKAKKKGFTLIELMIVIAIIAILAVVLLPKSGSSKTAAKESGILVNNNAVLGVVTSFVGKNATGSDPASLESLQASLNTSFGEGSSDVLVNPLVKAAKGVSMAPAATAAKLNAVPFAATSVANVAGTGKPAVVIANIPTAVAGFKSGAALDPTIFGTVTAKDFSGCVMVVAGTDSLGTGDSPVGYAVFGVDSAGLMTNVSFVK